MSLLKDREYPNRTVYFRGFIKGDRTFYCLPISSNLAQIYNDSDAYPLVGCLVVYMK